MPENMATNKKECALFFSCSNTYCNVRFACDPERYEAFDILCYCIPVQLFAAGRRLSTTENAVKSFCD